MKRRNFLISAAALPAGPLALAGEITGAKAVTFRVVLIDPQLVTSTGDTISVGWQKKKSDVMGSVYLSQEESAKLTTILSGALTESRETPACGHAPAYVLVRMEGGRAVSQVSVCALCLTWCGADGVLRVLQETRLMPFLATILPLPAAFSKVTQLPDLLDMDAGKSFLELPSPL